jgi:hypothetical protein
MIAQVTGRDKVGCHNGLWKFFASFFPSALSRGFQVADQALEGFLIGVVGFPVAEIGQEDQQE